MMLYQIYWVLLVKEEQGLNVQPHLVHSRRASMVMRASEPHNYDVSKDTAHMDLETGFPIGARPVCIQQGLHTPALPLETNK